MKKLLPKLIMMLAGGMVGAVAGMYLVKAADISSFGEYMALLLGLAVASVLAFLIQLTAHEAGHMIFGLISGYGFVSFRLGSLMLMKTAEGLMLKRYSLAGTAGQCLMSPPERREGKFPFVMYNLGGVIMNILLALLFLWIRLALRPEGIFGLFCTLMAVTGAALAMTNGLPLNTDMIANDGYNALHLSGDIDAMNAFWTSLKINELQSQGVRLRDMDERLLELSDKADLKNPLVTTMLVLRENMLLDRGELGAAREQALRLLSDECRINGLYDGLLKLDLIYMDVLERGEDADLSALETKEMKRLLAAMKGFPSVVRTLYALCGTEKGREACARATGKAQTREALKERFERMAAKYPYPTEIESERELMVRCDK